MRRRWRKRGPAFHWFEDALRVANERAHRTGLPYEVVRHRDLFRVEVKR